MCEGSGSNEDAATSMRKHNIVVLKIVHQSLSSRSKSPCIPLSGPNEMLFLGTPLASIPIYLPRMIGIGIGGENPAKSALS